MAHSTSEWVDKALRRLPPGTDPGNPEQWVNGALQRMSRAALQSIFRPDLGTELSLTMGVADAYGIQSVSIASSGVLDESVMVIDSVRHSDLASIGPLVLVESVKHLLPPHVFGQSVYGFYRVEARTIYCRRPSATLATTSGALKAFGVSLLTAVSAIPNVLEGVFEDLLVSVGMEIGQPNQPATPDEAGT